MHVYHELRKHSSHHDSHDKLYNYLQIQSKALPNDNAIRIDDWTDSVMAFAFVLSFSVVMPAITPVALLTNLVQSRCRAHRNVCLLQRPLPIEAAGIGVWMKLLYIVEALSVIVLCSLACFTMQPLRDFDTKTEYIVFVAAQYVIFLGKGYIRGIYSRNPAELEELRLTSEDTVRRSFVNFESHPVDVKPVTEVLPPIGPRAFTRPENVASRSPARQIAKGISRLHEQVSSAKTDLLSLAKRQSPVLRYVQP